MGVPQWPSYQSESNFRDANKFVPERWLGDPEYAHDERGVLQPFSVGPRNCIGKKYVSAPFALLLSHPSGVHDKAPCAGVPVIVFKIANSKRTN